MTKKLLFEIKQNQTKPPKVYIRIRETRAIIGSFSFDELPNGDAWENLPNDMQLEIQQFIDNLKAIVPHMSNDAGYNSEDIRFRLPKKLLQAWHEISALYKSEGKSFDIYEPMVKSIMQTMMSAGHQLNQENRYKMDFILAKAGLIYYNRLDHKHQNKAIFTELLKIHHKSEKLYQKALDIFQKDKSFSPKAIENMANGDMNPQKWLSASALLVMMDEGIPIINFINFDDLFMLCIKPLLDHGLSKENALALIAPSYVYDMSPRIDNFLMMKERHSGKHEQL